MLADIVVHDNNIETMNALGMELLLAGIG